MAGKERYDLLYGPHFRRAVGCVSGWVRFRDSAAADAAVAFPLLSFTFHGERSDNSDTLGSTQASLGLSQQFNLIAVVCARLLVPGWVNGWTMWMHTRIGLPLKGAS